MYKNEYKRLTKQSGWQKDMDLTQEMGYSWIYQRLSELENKIEHGTLVELPCKVGDAVYEIAYVTIHCGKCDLRTDYCPNGNFRSGQEVVEREINDMDDYCYLGKDGQVYLSDGVFLTREEAEKRLLELQGGKE